MKRLFKPLSAQGIRAAPFSFLWVVWLSAYANPYSLEQSLTGSEVMSLSGGPYDLEVGWEDWSPIYEDPANPCQGFAPVHAFILLRTDLATGESVVLLSDGVEVVPGWKKAGWLGSSLLIFTHGYITQGLGGYL